MVSKFTLHSQAYKKRLQGWLLMGLAAVMALQGLATSSQLIASADTLPANGTPSTVSADPLPTVQVDGVVWATATYGNTVYATGRFSYARPAGVALGGAGTVTRANLLAFDIRTGVLDTSFVHSLSGSSSLSPCYGSTATGAQGCAIEVSPDGKRLYVGGRFSTVDGQAHTNFAAIDLTTNKVLSGFSGPNSVVYAVAATNSMVYVGGSFSSAGGAAHSMLAAYNANGTLSSSWKADVTGKNVRALTIAANHLVVGGLFNKINGSTYYSLGAVSLTNGSNITPWASKKSSFPFKDQDPTGGAGTGITSLSTDGKQVYLTSFTYITTAKHPETFEGRAAINPKDGTLIWMNDCVGDSYDAYPIGNVLYSAGHAHSCQAIGGFPDTTPRIGHHALAETTYKTGKNTVANGGSYPNYVGQPASTLLNWTPTFTSTNFTGMWQNGWTVTGNTNYVVYGGEFGAINGTAQQGLVRFGVASVAPNKVAPSGYEYAGYGVAATPANKYGKSTVRVYTAADRDNTNLTYEVYRTGSTKLLASKTVRANWWQSKSWTFTDTGIKKGTSLTYTVVIKDGYGNTKTVSDSTLINDNDSRITYKGSSWKSVTHSDRYPDFGRNIHRTTKNGNYLTMKFTGTSLVVYSEKSKDTGKISISIDGGKSVVVDTHIKSGTTFQAEVYSVSGLSAGSHTVKIKKVSGKYMIIDAFKVR